MTISSLRQKLSQLLLEFVRHPRPRPRRRQRGMTLVEVMVVVVIITMVAGIVGVSVFSQLKSAQRNAAYVQIKDIGKALELYKLSTRRFPSTGEGLKALTQPVGGTDPVMPNIPADPWGAEYVYIFPGTHNTGGFDLMSYGPDGVQGGADDVNNWESPDAAKKP